MTCSSTTSEKTPLSTASCTHRDVELGDLAAHLDGHRLGQPAGDGGEDPAELLGQRQPRADVLGDDAAGLHVDRVGDELALQRQPHRAGHGGAGLVLRLGGRGAQVRRDDGVRQPEQRAVGAWAPWRRRRCPAAPTWPDFSASASAASSTSPPRAALTMITPRLVVASSRGADQARASPGSSAGGW